MCQSPMGPVIGRTETPYEEMWLTDFGFRSERVVHFSYPGAFCSLLTEEEYMEYSLEGSPPQ